MKTNQILLLTVSLLLMSSCRSTRGIGTTGYTLGDALDTAGTKITKVPYIWYTGTARSNDKQMAIEAAQAAAYNAISRTIELKVNNAINGAGLDTDGVVHKALKSHWEQTSKSLIKGAHPFGDCVVSYDPKTGMYDITAKVAIRGDIYKSLLKDTENAENIKQNINIKQEELNDFIKVNNAIFKAVQGEN